jgi:predicted kinase
MKQTMTLLIGLPGSGKTQEANRLLSFYNDWRRLSWDDLRAEDPNYVLGRFNRKQEDAMKQRGYDIVRGWHAQGFSVVIDNTNLTESTRHKWRQLAEELNMNFNEQAMLTSVESCISLDRRREGHKRVGRAVIERMALFNGMIKFPSYEQYVIVDMDGTLSDSSERQKYLAGVCSTCDGSGIKSESLGWMTFTQYNCPDCNGSGKGKKDWKSFFGKINEDNTNPFVEALIRAFSCESDTIEGKRIIIVSGRPIDQCGKATEDWLDRHYIPYQHLFMRQGGDKREDTIIKKEILDKLPKDQIFCAIDDRPSIVRMWRENGLNVIDVGKGVEF